LDEHGQPIIQLTDDALVNEESINEDASEVVEEVTPESEDKSDEQK
jgi:hypothetical protein